MPKAPVPNARARDRVRPGGRSERIRESVLQACLELLAEGLIELPVALVAERSGVNRGTVYRWWPTQESMIHDAVEFHTAHRMDAPDTGSWESDVRQLMTQQADLANEPIERALMATMATGRYPTFNDEMLRETRSAMADWASVVTRAIARGEVSDDVDVTSVLNMATAPIITISLFEQRRVASDEIERLVKLVCRATAPQAGRGGSAVERSREAPAAGKSKPATPKTATRKTATRKPAKPRARKA